MPRPRWPHLQREVTRHGQVFWTVRISRSKTRVRLRAAYGTPEFEAEYHAAVRGEVAKPAQPRDSVGTLAWLWDRYRETSAWTTAIAEATRRQRENIMSHVIERIGAAPLEDVTQAVVIAGRERRAATPSQANNYLAAMNGLFAWAVKAGHVKTNPCAGVETLKRPKTGGFPEWTPEDEAAYLARWPLGTPQHLAYMVHACTGLRRGDAVRLGRQHFKPDGRIHLRAEKNGANLRIPIHPELIEAIEACPPVGLTILATQRGKPWGKASYGNQFAEWARAAGVAKNSHGIRKLAATRVCDAGASEAEMMALFGWTDPAMARVYTRSRDEGRLADQATAKLFPNLTFRFGSGG